MKKFFKKSLLMTLVTVLLIGTFAISADAVMKRTVKYQKYNASTSSIKKKAVTVKKGTTNLTITKGEGWIKFKAPSTKTYSFTFSNLKTKNDGVIAYVDFKKQDKYDKNWLTYVKVATKGGKTDALWLKSKDFSESTTKLIYRPLNSRTGKVKLKKGEILYMYYSGREGKKNTAKLVIK